MAGYWYDSDLKIVKGDDFLINQTWKTAAGVAVDISSWVFRFEANEKADGGTGNVIVLDAAMTKSDSGTGVTDKVSIPISNTQSTAAPAGRYDYDIVVVIGSDTATVARGALTFYDSQQD